jgi:uncharacterized protein with NAD-binding domain and iron-sulfur cluster
MMDAVRASPYGRQTDPLGGGDEPPGWLHSLFHKSEVVFVSVTSGLVGGVSLVSRCCEHVLLDMAHFLVHWHGHDPQTHPADAHAGLSWLLEQFMRRFERRVAGDVERDDGARRLFILLDFFHAVIRGALADGVLLHGFSVLDDHDFREWLEKNGASDLTLESAPLRAYYDYFFAYEGGDPARPTLAAGAALYHLMRLTFTYKTAIFWEMQAGMGDAVIAPLYEVLKRRGVNFAFFHRVEGLGLSEDGKRVATVRVARQATPKNGDYRPLIEVKGLPCWPSEPLYEQLAEGEELRRRGIDLESPWSPWPPVETVTLQAGRDFDQVLLGITLAPLKTICAELIAASPAWQKMIGHLKTVQTFGVQVWLGPDRDALGWTMPAPLMTGYANLLNTWGDFSHLLPREVWPEGEPPRSLAYFCGAFPDASAIPDHSAHDFPEQEREQLRDLSVEWLQQHLPYLLPATATAEGGFNWSLLADPEGRTGPDRFEAQYWRANVSPAERYVLSVPGDWRYRLRKGHSGFDNLVVAGDWVYTGLGGCVEAAVMSGMMASRALTGAPRTIVGEVTAHDPGPEPATSAIKPPHRLDRNLSPSPDDEVRAGAP